MTHMNKREIHLNALSIGLATGAYALSFGAISIASGLDFWQTQTLSLFMFTGASQFAFIGVVGTGGSALAASLAALMLGLRNALYGLRMAPVLGVTGFRGFIAAQLTIDESTAMAIAREDSSARAARYAFWATGISIYLLWNGGTLIGALGAGALGSPTTYGLDAVIPAAFLALLWPRLTGRQPWVIGVAIASALVALALTPVLQPGLPVLAASLVAIVVGLQSGLALAPPPSGNPRESPSAEDDT